MKVYNCKVRNKGDVRDEVLRKAITAAEIKVLRHIHGEDAVLDITLQTAEAERTEDEERARLEQRYGEKPIAEVFGVRKARLDDDLPKEELPEEVRIPTAKRNPIKPARAAPEGSVDALM